MQFPSKEQVARQRRLYPAGTRIELIQMDDAQAPPVGTRGTVSYTHLLLAWKQKSNEPSGKITACAISPKNLRRFNTCTK